MNSADQSDKIQGMAALILQEPSRGDALALIVRVIDFVARHSGNREMFWGEVLDLVDAAAEATESSTALH
jgi:hypothetical protein